MKGILFVIAACFLWAIDALIRYPLLMGGVSASKIVLYEHALLSLIFLPYFFKIRAKVWDAKVSHLFYFAVVGGLGSAVATVSFTKAFVYLNPSLVIVLQKLQPIVAVVLAKIVLHENVHKKFIMWGMVALFGTFLISFDDIFSKGIGFLSLNDIFSSKALWGYLLALMAVVGWGAATVFGKKLSLSGYEDKEIMCGRFLIGFLTMLPIAFYENASIDYYLTGQQLVKILLMVFISGLLAMYVYYQGLKRISARYCAVAEMFFPFAAVIVNWIFLGATLSVVQIIGGGFLILGSTVIQWKKY